jgi:hypothetical protein
MDDIRYCAHARQRMIERGISEKEVKKAIMEGSKVRRDGRIVASYSYFDVVYMVRNKHCYVITVMLRW